MVVLYRGYTQCYGYKTMVNINTATLYYIELLTKIFELYCFELSFRRFLLDFTKFKAAFCRNLCKNHRTLSKTLKSKDTSNTQKLKFVAT